MDFSTGFTSDNLQASQGALNPSATANFSFGTVPDIISGVNLPRPASSIYTVNSIADVVDDNDGVTTLREAINFANAIAGVDSIVFDSSLFASSQTISLTLGELNINDSLNIFAPIDPLTSTNLLTVSGNNASRVFEIDTTATVNFFGLIIADGSAGDNGGGIKNSGTLTLNNSIVRNNTATLNSGSTYGGGIYNTGILTLNNSTIRDNKASASGSAFGGGIYNTGIVTLNDSNLTNNEASGFLNGSGGGIDNTGTLTVNNSTVSNNSARGAFNIADGGGINNSGGIVTVSNSTLSSNSVAARGTSSGGAINNSGGTVAVSNTTLSNNLAAGRINRGGGIVNLSGSILELSNSTVIGNQARDNISSLAGGILNGGTLRLSNTTVGSNSAVSGGGIYNIASGTVTISNSTINGNSADFTGGGIYNAGSLTASNSTISDNSVFRGVPYGGGIFNNGTLSLVFTTITRNQAANGGGVFNDASGTARVRNTIIAANLLTIGGINPDVSGNFTSNGYNLIGDATGSTGFGATGDIIGTSSNPIDPRLSALSFNGGPTATIALLPDSPAINAGDPTLLPGDPTTDQRGNPRVSGGRADIGAFELTFA
ncbi:choice-of-anchor Q domain-containing protein [Scytonema sp. PCC 10023]|uniref:choice-of-anchor Q domain-containing protein n=1 Tax=Scytonema sp. PCC 10023 TaxID=1680591 RepID=UPI0039C61F3D